MNPLRVIVGCECSGRVREAFRSLGHDAWSCDILPAEDGSPFHIQGTILDHQLWKRPWDVGIFHPDCNFLAGSGARWWSIEWRKHAQQSSLHFVKALWSLPIGGIAIENPVGALSSLWMKPAQIVEPFHFGDPFKKATCLWLKNLPPLVPTNNLGGGEQACWKAAPSKTRKQDRSRTYLGIARAMAEQWGSLAIEQKAAA